MLELLLAGGAAYGGYKYTKRFVVKKLRFVPKARRGIAPWVAGAGALLIVAPLAAWLPLIGGLTAAALGAGVAGGVYAGDREVEKTNIWGDRR
ncbi:MAG: hypothetical protein AMS25_02115 [Gemmatimonas sp. SM23_52]|nr:MAG: hypothetical protein AMS25_02115 [Gemmatimonas sp. SM23_52]